MNYLNNYSFLLISFLFTFSGISQDTTSAKKNNTTNKALYVIEDGDTIPIFVLKEFNYKDPTFESQWIRTVFFAKRMYTYAKIIDSIVEKHEAELAAIKKQKKKRKRKQKKENKKLKKTLWDEYAYEIKNLTNTRGDYLTRMVHKETGITCYDLIKKYKNGTTAFFWNSVLWSFGSTNLKNEFDPKKDWMLKLVIEDIEAGKIIPFTRAHLIQEMKAREEREKRKK